VNYGDNSGDLPGTVTGNTCTGPAHSYTAYGLYTVTVTVSDKDGGAGSNSAVHTVIFEFAGFFQPVDNLPTLNIVNAGRTVPVKFSLGGYQGLAIFAPGYPKSQLIACASGVPVDYVEETVVTNGSGLSYDPDTDRYHFNWKTDRAWAGTCRQLVVRLVDGSTYSAHFMFK
jgi:hypothetical protein